MKENKKKRGVADFFKDNFQKIILVVICVLYVSQGLFKLEKKDATVIEILGNVGISVIFGVVITDILRTMGLKNGRNSEIFIASLETYGEAKQKATPMFDKLSSWCEYKNSQELEFRKKEIIQTAGLNWKGYKLGYYEEHTERISDVQKKAIEDAKNCKIVKFYSQELLSDLPQIDFKNGSRFGKSEKEYSNRKRIADIFWKLFISLICGLYGLYPLLTGDNATAIISGVLWNTLQIIIWLSLGCLKYADAKSFILDEYRQTHVIQKTELLNEFLITMTNNPQIIDEYDEDVEIDQYIEEFIRQREANMVVNVNIPLNEEEENEQETILD